MKRQAGTTKHAIVMNICEHLTETARHLPEQPAILFEGQSFTYAQLDGLSIQAANRLIEAGVTPGDRVAIMLPNVPAFVVWYYAALRVGAIAVSISTRLTKNEVAFVVADCDAKAFVAGAEQLSSMAEYIPSCVARSYGVSESGNQCESKPLGGSPNGSSSWFDAQPDDPALILYTSGTTGFAKGATLSHVNVRSNVLQFNHLCDMQSDDRILLAVPLFHCFGQNALLNSALNVGATIVLQRGFDLNESKRLIREHQVTQLYGVPTMFQLLHESCETTDLDSIRYCFSAAAKLPMQVSQRWLEKFKQPIYEGYGLTETSPFASYNHHENYIIGSIGTPIDSVEMKIADSDSGETCPPGEMGEIAMRGPNVMLGYWNRPEDTAAAIRDGWFYSGDIGRQDENDFFYVVDRVKDMIAVGGLKVYPAEVERILLDHDAIAQVAVVGFPDEVFGEKVVAFVVLSDASSALSELLIAELLQHCRDNLANYKVPKHFLSIAELPRNPSGKVLKTKLRDYDLTGLDSGNSASFNPSDAATLGESLPAQVSPLRETTLWNQLRQTYPSNRLQVATDFVQGLVQVLSGSEDLPAPDARFLEIGLDSLMIVEISSQVQAEVGGKVEIPATLVFDYPRVSDLAAFLEKTFADGEAQQQASESSPAPIGVNAQHEHAGLREEIEAMSEEEALGELMRELESS